MEYLQNKKVRTIPVQDMNGNAITGSTVIAYPTGTTSNETTGHDNKNGTYTFTFDALSNYHVICEAYDIYVDGNLRVSNMQLIEEWKFTFIVSMTVDMVTKVYNNILDSEGDHVLPSQIPNPFFLGCDSYEPRKVFLSREANIDELSITLQADAYGMAKFPFPVVVKILGGLSNIPREV